MNLTPKDTKSYATGPGNVGKTIWAWGDNTYGELGDGTTTQRLSPVQISSLSGSVAAIAAGMQFTVALKTDGTVWVWGYNSAGELGNGTHDVSAHSTPAQVSGLSHIIAISTNQQGSHILALRSDGTVWAWGFNGYGAIGNGTTTTPITSPSEVLAPSGSGYLTHIIAVAAGGYASMALKSDGTLWVWGQDDNGFDGTGTCTPSTNLTRPTQVSNISNVKAITMAGQNVVALEDDGTVWTWGNDSYQQDGYSGTCPTPTQISTTAVNNVSSIATNGNLGGQDAETYVLDSSGALYHWQGGQYISAVSPTSDSNFTSGVADVKVGGNLYFSQQVLKTDGTLWSWGANNYGQLGNGTTTDTTSPAQNTSVSHVVDISAGALHTVVLTGQ